ncbi:molybdopterin-dependent oxidoreductase, partial [Klebsiella pneumoniae]|nr:molybdopterin-dependent oxidoreductase [Klebsiella pneumoniae]
AQEKTGDFWLNGRLFGSQACHTTEDVEHADYVLFIGTNPFQAHGIPNARDTLKHIKKDPNRTMVVFDPRVTETAKQADIHVQLKPGTDAFLMSAMIAATGKEKLFDAASTEQHTHG